MKDKASKEHDGEMAKRIIMRAREYGVLLSRDGVHHNIIKIKPPIVFNDENVDMLMKVLDVVVKELAVEIGNGSEKKEESGNGSGETTVNGNENGNGNSNGNESSNSEK